MAYEKQWMSRGTYGNMSVPGMLVWRVSDFDNVRICIRDCVKPHLTRPTFYTTR